MKNFRSSKLLKPVDPQTKEEGALRIKIKQLQEQIQLLQKSNLNIFIPLSEHPTQPSTNYEAIINKLKSQIISLQKDNQNQKSTIKKLERQKQQMRINHANEIRELKKEMEKIIEERKELEEEVEGLKEELGLRNEEYEKLEKLLIEKNVQLKFLHEDFQQAKQKIKSLELQIQNFHSCTSAIIYGSRVLKAKEKKFILLEKSEYDELHKKIRQLQQKIAQLIQASQRDIVTLGVRKSDIGEEIVRLKDNIDLQLGLEGKSKHSEEFLKIYKGTNELFEKLIRQCKR